MLAVFCLRLALGMLASLLLLNPKVMHPRFFRTHFLTALGLTVVAIYPGWDTEARTPIVIAAVFTLVGSLVWIFDRSPIRWPSLFASALAMVVALGVLSGYFIIRTESVSVLDYSYIARSGYLIVTPEWVRLLSDITAAALLGFSMTAMLVGHSYLISPGLTIKPLMGQILGFGIALALRAAVCGVALWFWSGEHDLSNLNDETVLWLPVRWLIGLAGPAVFGFLAFRTAQIKSTQSATGILYVVVILAFLGELTSLLLTRNTGLPL